jgi:hypothetical protein
MVPAVATAGRSRNYEHPTNDSTLIMFLAFRTNVPSD